MNAKEIRTIVCPNVSARFGAPMGRQSFRLLPSTGAKIRDRLLPMRAGGYDAGGAYWGAANVTPYGPGPMRVQFAEDGSYLMYYREGDTRRPFIQTIGRAA